MMGQFKATLLEKDRFEYRDKSLPRALFVFFSTSEDSDSNKQNEKF